MIKKGDCVLNVNGYPSLVMTDPDANGMVEVSGYMVSKCNLKHLKKLTVEVETQSSWAVKSTQGTYAKLAHGDIEWQEKIPNCTLFTSKNDCESFIAYYIKQTPACEG